MKKRFAASVLFSLVFCILSGQQREPLVRFSDGSVLVRTIAGYETTVPKDIVPMRNIVQVAGVPLRGEIAFREGLMAIMFDTGKIGFTDAKGNVKIPPRFVDTTGFSEKRAAVCMPDPHDEFSLLWGYIDANGNFAVPPLYWYARPFREGRGVVSLRNKFDAVLWMLIDSRGERIGSTEFDELGEASGGRIPARKGNLWGFADLDGSWILPPVREEINGFSEDRAAVRSSGRWMLVDRNGKPVPGPVEEFFPPESGLRFSEGLAVACAGTETVRRFGYLNRDGTWAIRPQFRRATDFSSGAATILVVNPTYTDDPGRYAIIDAHGRFLVEPGEFSRIGPFTKGMAPARKADRTGFIDTHGEWIADENASGDAR